MSSQRRRSSSHVVHGLRRRPQMPRETLNPRIGEERAVLILSEDAVAAALLGALVETLGYQVRFAIPPESPDDSFRRARPTVALIDGEYQAGYTDDVLGHAAMRGISVVIFGNSEVCNRVRALAVEHNIATLLMPPDVRKLELVLRPSSSQGLEATETN